MVTINRYIKALLYPAGGHQGSHKAHQAGNQTGNNYISLSISEWQHIYPSLTLYTQCRIIKTPLIGRICISGWLANL